MRGDALGPTRFRGRLAAAGRPGIVVLAIGLLALVAAVGVLALAAASPTDGAVVTVQRSEITADAVEVGPVHGGSLRRGDLVGSIDGEPLGWRSLDPVETGDHLRYGMQRDRHGIEQTVTVRTRPVLDALGSDWGGLVLVPSLVIVGALLLWRRPDVAATRALFLLGCLSGLSWVLITVGPSPLDLATGRWWALLGGPLTLLAESALLHFVLVFPTPPPARVHLRLVAAAYTVPLLLHAADALLARADSSLGTLGPWMTPRLEPLLVLVILAVPLGRLRRTVDPVARRQLRLVALQLLASGAIYGLVFALPPALGGDPILPSRLASISFWPFLVVLAVAVLRFDLFELRLIAHRSLLYGLLTAAVVGAYAATVGLVSAITGEHVGFVPSAIAAGVLAVVAQPLRARLQLVVDRLVYGLAAEPYEVLAELGRRLEGQAQPGAALGAVVETLARSLDRSYVAIEVPEGEGHDVAARIGDPTPDVAVVPLVHQQVAVGRLVVGLRDPAEQLGPTEQRLVADLAGHVGTALAAARLTLDVRRSRERLVLAREEERRRVGRDLHDDLGPRLAAANMKLEAAGRMVNRDLDAALALHDEVRTELNDVIGDVRRVVYALRPPALDQLGLVGALRELANRLAAPTDGAAPTDMVVVVHDQLPELPAAVEVAAYRIASEAMTNAARHAGATRVVVHLQADDALGIDVVDDGRGLPELVIAGVGMASMDERADELGGALSIEPGADGGTRVTARLPLEGT